MKKFFLLVSLILSLFAFTNAPPRSNVPGISVNQKTDSVYICNSTTGYDYNSSSDCRGLNRCTHGVLKVSLYDATHKYGRQPCKICEQ